LITTQSIRPFRAGLINDPLAGSKLAAPNLFAAKASGQNRFDARSSAANDRPS